MTYIYTYKIDGEVYEIEQQSRCHELFYDTLAEECANEFFSNCDGLERKWPITLELFDEDKRLGVYTVEMEMEPRFTAWWEEK